MSGYPTTEQSNHILPIGSTSLAFGLVSVREAISLDALSVRLFASQDCYLSFGDNTIVANSNSIFFAAGTERIGVPVGSTHIAVIRVITDGFLNITSMKGT